MTISAGETLWVTAQTLERLRNELGELTAAASTNTAQRQQIDARIRELEQMLKRAEVGEKPDDGLVEPGMEITVRLTPGDREENFLLGSREVLNSDTNLQLDVYSPTSPLGEAINGKRKGDIVSYLTPTGTTVHVEIINAVPFRS